MFSGQGSQYKGMGKNLFTTYREEVDIASEILGYSLEELCITDRLNQLGKTEFTQPALFVVNALGFKMQNIKADYFIGHSLGEYNALHAAGVFDFETGVRLVQKRGTLMAAASGGAMAAVIGIRNELLLEKLNSLGFSDISIANYNTPTQHVVAGTTDSIGKLVSEFENQGVRIVPLMVSAAFHSNFMAPAVDEFKTFLEGFSFVPPKIPVVSNFSAEPYEESCIKELLVNQISGAVRWSETIDGLVKKGVTEFVEIGGRILTKMVNEIKTHNHSPDKQLVEKKTELSKITTKPYNKDFLEDYNVDYPYVAGGMQKGISSKEFVARMAKAKILSYFGSNGLSFKEIEDQILQIQYILDSGEPYGVSMQALSGSNEHDMMFIQLLLKKNVTNLEISGYHETTEPIAYYRIMGLVSTSDGRVECNHRIMAKVSHFDQAKHFMEAVPIRIIDRLINKGLIDAQQGELARRVPVSHDICALADSGGLTEGRVAMIVLPSIIKLRDDTQVKLNYTQIIRVGLSGGIGTPHAVAWAFNGGADFVVTGSINQCTVEANVSDYVKDQLQRMTIDDTSFAPAESLFEYGKNVQVLNKGTMFHIRANKLYQLYLQFDSLELIPVEIIAQLEKEYFLKPLAEVWTEITSTYTMKNDFEIIKYAQKKPKYKMALIFRWYLNYSLDLAFEHDLKDLSNLQVYAGPSLGAFNQWVKGTHYESWRNRHVDDISKLIMDEATKMIR